MQQAGRSSGLERGGISREKRPLEKDGISDGTSDEKRQRVPALASVILEAVKMDSLQKLCSQLEPVLRRVVGEEVERALAKLVPAKLGTAGRSSPKRLQGPDSRSLWLQFRNKLALPLFTGSKVEGEQGSAVHIVLVDATTGKVVTTGQEASAKLDVVVLEGDFSNDDDDDWTKEDFENHVVKEREGKRPLLNGDLTVTLKDGVGTLGEVTFTDNSSWIRSRKFRLGVKVASGFCEDIRIREAKTEAFNVKDHRGELYKKHYPPSLQDEVWRLDKIGKDGAFHKRLNESGIRTVEDFLRLVVVDPQKLKNILGSGMSQKMWDSTVEHAKTCVLNGKLYVYYPNGSSQIGVIFNNIYQLMGLISNEQYYSVEILTETEKVYVDKLVKAAYDNWSNVVEYVGDTLISDKPQALKMVSAQSEDLLAIEGPSVPKNQQAVLFDQRAALVTQPVTMQQTYVVPTAKAVEPYDYKHEALARNQGPQSAENSQLLLNMGASMQSSPALQVPSSFPQQNKMPGNEALMGLALHPGQVTASSNFGYHHVPFTQSSAASNLGIEWSRFKDTRGQEPYPSTSQQVDEFFSEDEIRARSMELLYQEDMQQQLLRMYNANGAELSGAFNVPGEEVFVPGFSAVRHDTSFNEDKSKPSGKAYVGWLKLKAALRWGIFIRKIAAEKAEKRAQLTELEDE